MKCTPSTVPIWKPLDEGEKLFDSYLQSKKKGRYEECLVFLRQGCDVGCGKCMCELGLLYMRGTIVETSSKDLGLEWFKKSADTGYPRGCYQLGHTLWESFDNKKEAEKWLKHAVDLGDHYAKGRCLYHGWGGFQANLDKAAEAFKAGAEEGFLSICTLFFFNGEEGDIDSHRLYGFCLERGFGGNCNLKEAFANYLAAAEQADAISSQIAARFLMQGKGCERNLTKAWYCYRRADDQHYRRASHMLNDVAFKNFFMHERCRERVIWLLTLKKVHKNDCGMFSILMPDLVKIIAQKLWETRNDDEWKTNEELLEMDKKK